MITMTLEAIKCVLCLSSAACVSGSAGRKTLLWTSGRGEAACAKWVVVVGGLC